MCSDFGFQWTKWLTPTSEQEANLRQTDCSDICEAKQRVQEIQAVKPSKSPVAVLRGRQGISQIGVISDVIVGSTQS